MCFMGGKLKLLFFRGTLSKRLLSFHHFPERKYWMTELGGDNFDWTVWGTKCHCTKLYRGIY